jgi:hypothetical protein
MTAPTQDPYAQPSPGTEHSGAPAQFGGYPTPPPANRGRGYTIASVVCSVIALALLPIVLGPAGIALGLVGHTKGDPKGKWAGLLAVVCTIVGMVIGYVVLKNRG